MQNDERWNHLEGLLAQAGELSSATDPSAAQARARFALAELAKLTSGGPADDARSAEFRARAELELKHYDGLLARWQARNADRAASFLDRERGALARPKSS